MINENIAVLSILLKSHWKFYAEFYDTFWLAKSIPNWWYLTFDPIIASHCKKSFQIHHTNQIQELTKTKLAKLRWKMRKKGIISSKTCEFTLKFAASFQSQRWTHGHKTALMMIIMIWDKTRSIFCIALLKWD